mgnify:CR=1 FL=1
MHKKHIRGTVDGVVILSYIVMTLFAVLCFFPFYYIFIVSISDPDKVREGAMILYPQGFSLEADRDEQDKNALHVLGLDETGAARCTARVFADAPGVWHAGRIAVQRGLRGQGVGRLLLAAVADKARAQGARTLELGAQYDKQGFYEAVGFAPYGEPYLDEGYPHVPMRMAL